ncbi:diketogulonate reductase-like aldo/keto reductase [Nitrobacteraceae bacterium AZCC 2161]
MSAFSTIAPGELPKLKLPPIGLGTRLLVAEECSAVVEQAISIGYRYVDTAPIYGNEAAIGEGIRRSAMPREEIFVTTKVERDNLRAGPLRQSVENSLTALKSDYIDLLLIHWPNQEIPLSETIAAMGALRKRGLLKHIGVANFPIAMLDQAIELACQNGADIAANQVEIHPSLYPSKLIEACRQRGVATIAYSPMGRDDLKHPVVLEIASRLGRGPSQIILRWHAQQGVLPIPIPDTATRDQIAQQYDIFDFALSTADLNRLSSLTPQTRYFNPAWSPVWDPLV